MSMRPILLPLALLPLAACAPAEPPADGGMVTTCRNEPLAQFIGQPASQELGARMLAESHARVLRWVPKGGMVTMDFRGDRLTVQLDEANRVLTASCG
jgi:hypothetical protein